MDFAHLQLKHGSESLRGMGATKTKKKKKKGKKKGSEINTPNFGRHFLLFSCGSNRKSVISKSSVVRVVVELQAFGRRYSAASMLRMKKAEKEQLEVHPSLHFFGRHSVFLAEILRVPSGFIEVTNNRFPHTSHVSNTIAL